MFASGIPPASNTNSWPRPTVLTYTHGLRRCHKFPIVVVAEDLDNHPADKTTTAASICCDSPDRGAVNVKSVAVAGKEACTGLCGDVR